MSQTIDRRGFLGSTLALGAGLAMAPSAGAFASMFRPGFLMGWNEIRPGVFSHVSLRTGGNSLFLGDTTGAILVDSKFPFLGDALRTDVATGAELGEGGSITLVNTHHHGDHTGGNSSFVGRGPVYAHENAIPRVRAQLANYTQGARGGVRQAGTMELGNPVMELAAAMADRAEQLKADDFVPTHPVGDSGASLEIAGETIRLDHFGAGHTDNDLIVHLTTKNVIHTGDLVFNGVFPFFDQSAGTTPKGWIGSLERALELCDADTVVVPGHGPVGDRGLIENQIGYTKSLIKSVRREINRGTPKEEIATMSWSFMEGLGFEGLRASGINAAYDELTAASDD